MKLRRSGRTTRIDYAALNESHTIQQHNVHPHIQKFETFEDMSSSTGSLKDYISLIEDVEFNDNDLCELIQTTKLMKPILIRGANPNVSSTYNSKINLTFNIPNYNIADLTEKIGKDHKVPVMDVMTQNNSPNWDMQKWCNYFQLDKENRNKIRNVISLEISDTDLGKETEIPKCVQDLDMVLNLFKEQDSSLSKLLERNQILPPKVQKYILMSIAGSYTDFHIDFAGTSVYYSPMSGLKKFILIPPLDKNLDIYKKWCLSDNQNKTWFPSLLKPYTTNEFNKLRKQGVSPYYLNNGFVIDILPGDLLLLPSMWIHSVYTVKDSLIIGGNYLNLLSLKNHLKTYKIEIETRVNDQFKFPNFIKFIWLVAYHLVNYTTIEMNDSFKIDCYKNLFTFLNDQFNYISSKPSTKRDKLLISKIKASIPKEIIGDIPTFLKHLGEWINPVDIKKENNHDHNDDDEHPTKKQKYV